jgi:ArsR family transcriptional regulator, arsenate/arsenite/antimonite-responsive transcriptional repressor
MMNREFMAITKALADENRVRILGALQGGELCVCQVIELLGLAPSTVSKHLTVLRQAQLVDSRKDGRWIYYRLAGDAALQTVQRAIHWVLESLMHEEKIKADAKLLKAILKKDPEVLCCGQREGKASKHERRIGHHG